MIFKPSSLHKFFFTYICPRFYGGAPSTPSQTTQTVNQNNIPGELMPYVKTMMGAAENQVYTKDDKGKISGLQPYTPYSTDAASYVAPFSPLQQQAQNTAAGLLVPGQFGDARNMAQYAGIGQAGTANSALMYGQQGSTIGTNIANTSAAQAGWQQEQATNVGLNSERIGNLSADRSYQQGMGQQLQAGAYGNQGSGFGAQAAQQAGQGYNAQANFERQATDPNAIQGYMSPYMQNVVNQQVSAANRAYDITGAEQMGNATRQGAFGGSREALMAAENERSRNTTISGIQAQGLQSAFQNAQAQQQYGAGLGIQGLNAGTNAMQAGIQGAQTGLQGVQAQTAASQMQQQGAQQALQGYQQKLAGVQAQTAASQMQQQGAQLGIEGAKTGLAGVQGAQQGYAGAAQTAGTLGNLGQQELAAQTSIIGTQGQVGAQQQAQQQQAIDQAILDFKNAQQYPYMQIGTMSNLIRGIPMTNQTTTQYQAQPTTGSQIGGALATGLGAYAALKAKGGPIKDKGFKSGGIVGYKTGGGIEESMRSKLEDLDVPHLQQVVQNKESPKMASIAKEVLATKLAKGGIVGYAEEGVVKDKERLPDLMSDLAQQEDVIQEKINKQKAIKNAPVITNAAGITPVQAATLGPMSTNESLKNMALNQAEGFKPPLQASGIKAVEAPSVADKVLAPATTPFNLDQAMVTQQQDIEKLRLDANKDENTLIAEDRKRREEQLGPDTATIEYRKKIMDERANAPDEARRQMGMRLMEFGANWASTPGAPLVAGMRALKDGLPGVMEDTKANKKAMKEIDASIYALDHAARLEAEGYLDRAIAYKEKAQDRFMKAAPQVIDAAVKKETLDLQEQQNKITQQHYRAIEANQAASLAQNAEQFKVTSAQPTAAGMKEQAIKEVMKAKGVDYGTAYGIVESFGSATKDPTLGYRVAMAKTKLDAASDVYNSSALLGPEAKQQALDKLQAATAEFENLQRQFDPTGVYGTVPAPSVGPRAGSGQGGSGVKQGWSVTPIK